MVDISFQQYKMLKRISKQNTISTHFLSLEQRDICEFLCNKGFLLISKKERLNPDGEIDIFVLHPAEYAITQAGKAQISAYEASFHKWWISVVISVISLIISIGAWLY